MMGEDDKNRGVVVGHHHYHHPDNEHQPQPQPPPSGPPAQYGTFQGVANYPPPSPPVVGFPQPVPPPGATAPPYGYQTVPGYAVAEGRPVRQRRLPCCGIGIGWFLFIIGFFLGAIPWYVGVLIMLCARIDQREKPGYIACTIAAVLATVAIIIGVTKGADDW